MLLFWAAKIIKLIHNKEVLNKFLCVKILVYIGHLAFLGLFCPSWWLPSSFHPADASGSGGSVSFHLLDDLIDKKLLR